MAGRGHVPLRKCCGCGGRFAKDALVRFTLGSDGAGTAHVAIDAGGKPSGRGAYVCRRLDCFDAATGKSRLLQRRLRAAALAPELRELFIAQCGEEPLE